MTSTGAAIDAGSNSVHLLVARLGEDGLQPLRDESVLLGLGDWVDREGRLPTEAAAALVDAVGRYVETARTLGAQTVTLLGTEPLRRADNGAAVAAWVEDAIGLPMRVLTVRQEGQLTYLGATGGRPATGPLLVVDIGGGSSEVVVAGAGQPLRVLSLPSGSARLSYLVAQDPPTAAELAALLAAARQLVADLPSAAVERAIFVGGTATNLGRLAALDRGGLVEANRWLRELSAAAVSERFGVNLRRARQLPAGAALIESLLDHFALARAEVSQASLRDGAILATARLGEDWPALLDRYVGG